VKRALVLLALLTAPATAQQVRPLDSALVQQPFGQKPPPPPPELTPEQREIRDREHHRLPSWLYRGLVAAGMEIDDQGEIDTPVTGYGNEALWERPVLDAPKPAVVAVQRTPR
jgi:hypothetical protein